MERSLTVLLPVENSQATLTKSVCRLLEVLPELTSRFEILILDEATSALDNRTEAEIQRSLEGIIPDSITFVIAHRLTTVDLADRICVVSGGRIVGEGTKQQLMAACPEYRRLATSGLSDDRALTSAGSEVDSAAVE